MKLRQTRSFLVQRALSTRTHPPHHLALSWQFLQTCLDNVVGPTHFTKSHSILNHCWQHCRQRRFVSCSTYFFWRKCDTTLRRQKLLVRQTHVFKNFQMRNCILIGLHFFTISRIGLTMDCKHLFFSETRQNSQMENCHNCA